MARVLLFGRLADLAGWREREMTLDGRLSDLKAELARADPRLSALDGVEVQACVDQVITREDAVLAGAREVAFLPPFSGG